MDDAGILELYRERSEEAIRETEKKYGKYCYSIAFGILGNHEDSEECVNDALVRLWDSVPLQGMKSLRTYLARIVRNLAINRYREQTREKRGGAETTVSFSEVEDFVSRVDAIEELFDEAALMQSINEFLKNQKELYQIVFVQKYWYLLPVQRIAERNGISESKTLSILHRMRQKLKAKLRKEGYPL